MCGDVDILITLDDDKKSPVKGKTIKDEIKEIQGILPKIVN